MGGTWPKWFVLKGWCYFLSSTVSDVTAFSGIDLFSVATCKVPDAAIAVKGEDAFFLSIFVTNHNASVTECVSDHGKALCKDINGICVTETDGYYIVCGICLAFGVIFLVAFILPTARKLQREWLHYLILWKRTQHGVSGLPTSVWRVKMS